MLNEVDIDPTYCYNHPLILYGGSAGFLVLFDDFAFSPWMPQKTIWDFKVQSTLRSKVTSMIGFFLKMYVLGMNTIMQCKSFLKQTGFLQTHTIGNDANICIRGFTKRK